MFCNHCGAANPDVASFCNGCGKPIARPVAAPRPISEQFTGPKSDPSALAAASARTGVSPTAERLVASVLGEQGLSSVPRTLSTIARKEFEKGLETEVRKNIDDKAIPSSIAAGMLVLILLAAFNMVLACIAGLVAAGIAYKVVSEVLTHKQLDTIANISDEMLVTRYNEAKADRRSARTRSAIGWGVITIVAVVFVVAWLAARR
jgi:hypothetical protein